MSIAFRSAPIVVLVGVLAGCGGGGGGGGIGGVDGGGSQGGGSGTFLPSSTYANQCTAPAEKNFLRSWTNELYLWYSEVQYVSPSGNHTVADYFDLMKTNALTTSGQPKDKFHFTYDTAAWNELSQSGVEAGYGAEWVILPATAPERRRLVVAFTEPGSPAALANLTRGDEIIVADGQQVRTSVNTDALNAAFFPDDVDESHSFQVQNLAGSVRSVTLVSKQVTKTPVRASVVPTGSGPVGYLLFNDHIATSESGLIKAINDFKTAGVVDLVLDVRYNGGGYLAIASELGYMIAGTSTAGRTFERLVFNDKHPNTDPVTQRPLAPTPFYQSANFDSQGQALPTLNLQRVYVITGNNTCSASESIINGLRGIDVQVYLIGSTTCGKPYGFYPQDNCGTTYFSIQFKGSNEKNFGEYSDGFSPNNTTGTAGTKVAGCSVADDLTKPLGDETEGRLAATLNFRASNNQTCPTPSGLGVGAQAKPGQPLSAADGVMYKSPWRENRIVVE